MGPSKSSGKKIKKASGKVQKPSQKSIATSLKKRRRKNKYNSFKIFIFKVLKQVHPNIGISSKAMVVMDNFLHDMFDRISKEAALLVKTSRKSTMAAKEIETAVRLLIPGDLGKHAVVEGVKAIKKYSEPT